MGDLSRKAPLPTSHDFAPGSDPHTPAESQTGFAPDATYDDITLEPNRKEAKVCSSSSKGTPNNRPEPGSFDDIVSNQPPVRYEKKVVLITKLVKATPELLSALRRFCLNMYRNRRDGPSFSLAEKFCAAYIPTSHRAHLSLSCDHHVAIRETVGF